MNSITQGVLLIASGAMLAFGLVQLSAQHGILVPAEANFYDVIMGDTIDRNEIR